MAIKPQRILYRSKNNLTGLTVRAEVVRRNGVSVDTNVAFSEVSAANQPGLYELVLSTSSLGTYGGVGVYDFYINSTSNSAPDVAVRNVLAHDEDDLDVSIAAVQTVVNDIQSKVNNGTYGLSALKTLIDALQATANTTNAELALIEGTGFISANDSLKAISDRIFSGGRAI